MLSRRKLALVLSPILFAAAVAACGSDSAPLKDAFPGDDSNLSPPTGAGGNYDTGDAGPGSGAYGQGASSTSNPTGGNGQSGSSPTDGGMDAMEEPAPPMCDDSLKRCAHEFDYPAMNEMTVELRGSFAPDGWTTGVALTKTGSQWSATVNVPYNQEVQYKFLIDGTKWVTDPANAMTASDGQGGLNSVLPAATCTSFSCDQPPPLGYDWRDAVLYFVFVDRFYNGDPSNDGAQVSMVDPAANYEGGDWAGVTQKIDAGYFDDLGVNALWITVPMDNPEKPGLGTNGDTHYYSGYHGYWPVNPDQPEERFGTTDELKALVDHAHQHKIKVLLDYAMKHVYVDSSVYQQHQDWFWVPGCICGSQGCSWDDPVISKQCWFTDYLPAFNYQNDAARKYSVDNAITWAKTYGVDGFRLDAVKNIDDSWVPALRARVKTDIEPTTMQHFYMVGETFTGDMGQIKSYVDPDTKLDGQFDFPFRVAIVKNVLIRNGSMTELDGFMSQNENFYGNGIMSTFVGNHDVPRSIHFAEDTPRWNNEWADGKDMNWSNQPQLPSGTSAFQRLANAFTLIFTSKGIPLLYYGDEVAMPGAGDPDNRRMMQWDNYSDGQNLVLAHVKKLTQIRAMHPALRRGTRTHVDASNEALAYSMQTTGDTVYVAVNRSDSDQPLGNFPGATLTDLLSGTTYTGPSITIPARTSLVLVQK